MKTKVAKHLFIITASGPNPQYHVEQSIKNPITSIRCEDYFDSDFLESVKAQSSDGQFYAWGALPGSRNTPNWNDLEQGDYVLVYQDKRYTFVSRVIAKQRNERFAKDLWGTDSETGETWELMYFLDRPESIDIPVGDVADFLHSRYRGFTKIDENRINQIQSNFGSIEEFIARRLKRAQRLINPAHTWIFQVNPDFCDVRATLELQEVTWEVVQHKDEIIPEDRVYLWESGEEGGIVAIGEVLGQPRIQPIFEQEKPFIKDPEKFEGEKLRVKLRILEVVNPILTRKEILSYPKLANLSIFRQPHGTNFQVSSEEAEVLDDLLAKRRIRMIKSDVDQILELIEHKKQIILYGPPGTGKTFKTRIISIRLLAENNKNKEIEVNKEFNRYIRSGRIQFITFHSSYSYEEFIEGLTVHTGTENQPTDNLKYVLRPGLFKTFCTRALLAALGENYEHLAQNELIWSRAHEKYQSKSDSGQSIDWDNVPKFVLIVDEINRGDMSKIFGELITIIEWDKRLGAEVELAPTLSLSKDSFSVPQNVYIIATMNTADRSIALLDIALRRRFGFFELEPKLDLALDEKENKNLAKMSDHTRKLLEKSVEAIEIINENISDERSLGRDKRIGHSFMFNVKDTNSIEMVWKNEILPLLEEYCYSNEDKKKKILFSNETQSINLTNINEFLDLIINARKQTNRGS